MAAGWLVTVRHGQTAWNREGRYQGWADPPLDSTGRAQAVECAETLSELLDGGPTAPVISSDLRRAAATASVVADRLGVAFTVDAALREVDVGAWEGLSQAEVAARFPDEYRRWKGGEDIRRGGGETLAEAGLRVAGRLETALGEASTGAVLVVVGHGQSLASATRHLLARRVLAPIQAGEVRHLANAEHAVFAMAQETVDSTAGHL